MKTLFFLALLSLTSKLYAVNLEVGGLYTFAVYTASFNVSEISNFKLLGVSGNRNASLNTQYYDSNFSTISFCVVSPADSAQISLLNSYRLDGHIKLLSWLAVDHWEIVEEPKRYLNRDYTLPTLKSASTETIP